MSPDGAFYSLNHLPSWNQYTQAAQSLLAALEIDDPEETLMLQLTVSEVSLIAFSLLGFSRIFPEFLPVANGLSYKLADVSSVQEFLRPSSNDKSE